MKLYGIDGCKGAGWVVAEDTGRPAFMVVAHDGLKAIFGEAERGGALVVIDIPIGLPETEPFRLCDREARQRVGARRSSVFPVPCRAALAADGEEASQINLRTIGLKLSKQSLAILPRIREVDALMTPELQAFVREAHPEVIFAVLNDGPLAHGKKSRDGEWERLCVLRKVGLVFDLTAERARLGARHVGRDDVIDAAACLATAKRLVVGVAQPIAPLDRKGLRMEIVA